MDIKTFLKRATPHERQQFAEAAETSVAYLYQIAGKHKLPGAKLCRRLVKANPLLTLQELRPDIWGITF